MEDFLLHWLYIFFFHVADFRARSPMADDFDIEAMLEAPYRKVGDWTRLFFLLAMNWLFSLAWVAQNSEDEYLVKYVSQVCLTGRENDVLCDASANDLNYK